MAAHPRVADVRAYVAQVLDFLAVIDDDTVPIYTKRQAASALRSDGQKLVDGKVRVERRMVGRT